MPSSAKRTPGRIALTELISARKRLFSQVGPLIELPEPGVTLDLESRRDSETRTFKHLHQSSLLHREHFCITSRIKHLYLIDAYLDLAGNENGFGLYIVARSMFELSASLHEVRTRLIDATKQAEKNWRDAGQRFFGELVRARFATTQDEYKTVLRQLGLSRDRLKPLNVMNCINGLTQDPENADAGARYDDLCDFVHHNLGSATTARAGSTVARVAVSHGGGEIIMPSPGAITRYEYPIPSKFAKALEETCTGFLHDAKACIRWVNEMPETPYPPQLVKRFGGDLAYPEP